MSSGGGLTDGKEGKGKDLKPQRDKNAREEISGNGTPGQGENLPPGQERPEPTEKFRVTQNWQPGPEFSRQARTWGIELGNEPGFTPDELQQFRDYWSCEQRVRHQLQWEQAFAQSLNAQRQQRKPPGKRRTPSYVGFSPSVPDSEVPFGFNQGL
ncbi:DnaT-like ssDNA-binding domain-containing protein [Mangrovibacter sp. SLW1]